MTFYSQQTIEKIKKNESPPRVYKNIFTDKIISWVQDNYKRDFDYFNYNLEPFW